MSDLHRVEEDPSPTTWLNKKERGALLAMRLVMSMATIMGRRPLFPILFLIALYYRIFDRDAVRASREWLFRIHGESPGWWTVFLHFWTFVQVTFDRIFLLQGKTAKFAFTRNGDHHLEDLLRKKQGAVLLGAHLGSYESMRAGEDKHVAPINILGYFANAQMINALFDRLNPEMGARVIHLDKDMVSVMARIQACIERGELVAVLADRVGLSDRTVNASFLGEEASFAAGPFLIASLLRCPTFLVFGLYKSPNRYDLYCEPFAERIELPRQRRKGALDDYAQMYAERLEHFARIAPLNWFNFFDFWKRS